jgi:hypothetical protein
MTDVEPLLREHFSTEADEMPVGVNLLAGVETLRRTRRRRRYVGAASALAIMVVGAAVAVPLAVVGRHGQTIRVTVSPNQPAVPATPPPGERAITWAGIQFDVPAGWLSGNFFCGDPTQSAVVYELQVAPSCPGHAPSVQSVLPLAQPTLLRLDLSQDAPVQDGQRTTFAGLPAFSSMQKQANGSYTWSMFVPSRHAEFSLSGASAAAIRHLLATATTVETDARGCPARIPASTPRMPAAGLQALGVHPVSALVCGYGGSYLVGSAQVRTPASVSALAAAFDRAPTSYSSAQLAAQRQAMSPCVLAQRATVTFADADGSTHRLLVQPDPCSGTYSGVVGATSSTFTIEVGRDLSQLLPAGFHNGYIGGLQPDGCQSCELPDTDRG